MASISQAVQWAIEACNSGVVGYSQNYRNQQEHNGVIYYDCSSFIWYALLQAGFMVETAYWVATGTDYTYNAITTAYERMWLTALGFRKVDINGEWKQGDILWRNGHTEMVHTGGAGRGITMGAHSSKPALKDQVSINTFESTSGSWSELWRYSGSDNYVPDGAPLFNPETTPITTFVPEYKHKTPIWLFLQRRK